MKNSRSSLIIFLIVFVVLALLVALQNMHYTPPPEATTYPSVFSDVNLDNLQAIRLRSPETGQSFVLSRAEDGTWTAPDSAGTLNATEADNIARTMVLMPFERILPLNPSDDLTTYGFTPEGILAIEILLTNGDSHAVAVGYRTPTENSYYALVDDRPSLYLLERGAIDFLISRLKSPPVA